MKFLTPLAVLLVVTDSSVVDAFAPLPRATTKTTTSSLLSMALDPVSYLRTEWVSAALCTNQTPRSADVCLQLGTDDGRAVTFIPRTIREFITSSPEESGIVSVSVERQLKQGRERRGTDTKLTIVNQRADELSQVQDDTVDIVLSLQAAAKLAENGLDWKKSVQEAARVLKPGGRLLFCEQVEINGENYLEYAQGLMSVNGQVPENEEERFPIFEEGGADTVPMCPIPHIAGVAIKSENAGLTLAQAQRKAKEARVEKERLAEISIDVFESQGKRRSRKKKKTDKEEEAAPVGSSSKP